MEVWRYVIDMEAAWRRHGEGMEAIYMPQGALLTLDLIGYTISNRTYQTFHFKPYILLDIRYQ